MVLDTDLPLTLTLAAVTTGTRTLELNQQAVQSLLLS
jgi:hypothetical protein